MNQDIKKISTPLPKTSVADLYINQDYVYTISNLQNIFQSIDYLNSAESNQQDIINVLNTILKVLKYDEQYNEDTKEEKVYHEEDLGAEINEILDSKKEIV